ncbi:MAG: transcription termination factor NusA [Microscillaceae bacterium]|nr:transcription termination factor NusA [Microscillaceae bacterium]MDW8459816.1 transcription termination factor NusA [Cytophagales bacterium]
MRNTPETDKSKFIESFAEFAKAKGIDGTKMARLLEDVFRTMIRKKYGTDKNFDVIVNIESGDLEMRRMRKVVADGSPESHHSDKISLSEARKIDPDFEIGEELAEDISLNEFGRRAVLMARQTMIQKVKELEKEHIYEKYKEREGEIVVARVDQIVGRDYILLDNEGIELILPESLPSEKDRKQRIRHQIPGDKYKKGDMVKAVVHKVEMHNSSTRIILSRTSPTFLEKLFEAEIPEIADGIITIRKIVREPGERAKVAVESDDDRIDPVGACVGVKGSRIHSIVRELNNENIDVISYTENLELFIARALSPAKILSIKVEGNGRVSVFLRPDQVAAAIGKNGSNIKLASKLVGYEIDVFRETDEDESEVDIDLTEFDDDEIEPWVVDELRRIGLDTARSVLDLGKEELLKRTELEEEMIDYLLDLFQKELSDE